MITNNQDQQEKSNVQVKHLSYDPSEQEIKIQTYNPQIGNNLKEIEVQIYNPPVDDQQLKEDDQKEREESSEDSQLIMKYQVPDDDPPEKVNLVKEITEKEKENKEEKKETKEEKKETEKEKKDKTEYHKQLKALKDLVELIRMTIWCRICFPVCALPGTFDNLDMSWFCYEEYQILKNTTANLTQATMDSGYQFCFQEAGVEEFDPTKSKSLLTTCILFLLIIICYISQLQITLQLQRSLILERLNRSFKIAWVSLIFFILELLFKIILLKSNLNGIWWAGMGTFIWFCLIVEVCLQIVYMSFICNYISLAQQVKRKRIGHLPVFYVWGE